MTRATSWVSCMSATPKRDEVDKRPRFCRRPCRVEWRKRGTLDSAGHKGLEEAAIKHQMELARLNKAGREYVNNKTSSCEARDHRLGLGTEGQSCSRPHQWVLDTDRAGPLNVNYECCRSVIGSSMHEKHQASFWFRRCCAK
jgi:hypothetical protein